MGENIPAVNGRLFYFNYDGKLDIYYIKKRYPVIKKTSALFSECTELIWNRTY